MQPEDTRACACCQETGRVCALCAQTEDFCQCSETCGMDCPFCRDPLPKIQMAGVCIGFAAIFGLGVYLIPC
jgi:hypothetical protein